MSCRWKPASSSPKPSTPASARAAASRSCRRRRSPSCSTPAQGGLYALFRNCALAVLNSGSDSDNAKEMLRALPRLRRADRAPCLGHQAADPQRAGERLRRRPDDPRHQGAPVRGAARRGLHRQRDRRQRPLRPDAAGRDHQRGVPHPAQRAHARAQGRGRTWWSAGAATRSTTSNTSTPRTSATSWACAASTSAPAAARAP